jgi:subtilisin family serine protease
MAFARVSIAFQVAATITLCIGTTASVAQPEPERTGEHGFTARAPDIVPARCVSGTSIARREQDLPTVDSVPHPPQRQAEATDNVEYPHAEAELLVFPNERGIALLNRSPEWQRLFDSIGAEVVRSSTEIPFYRVRFSTSAALHEKAAGLRASPLVRSVRANSCVFPAGSVSVSDPIFNTDQWALKKIRIGDAWTIESGRKQVVVAVIDSAFEHVDNLDLSTRQWLNSCEDLDSDGQPNDTNGTDNPCTGEPPDGLADDFRGWNFYHGNNQLTDAMTHGTMIAGIIGAEPDNGLLIAGVNFDVRLMDLKVYHTGFASADGVLLAVSYAIRHGARVINASWTFDGYMPELEALINQADEKGIVVVAAAGNSSADLDKYVAYPCSFDAPNLICVASTTDQDGLESDSNYGSKAVHVGAPGERVQSTMGSSTGTQSGTSLAAPQVSGVAALLRAHCPGASASWIVGRLQDGPSVLGVKTRNGRRLDAASALSVECPCIELRPLLRRWGAWLTHPFDRQ